MTGSKGDDRKQEFLETALELFYEKGYEKTTIKDIIGRMGVSKGAFYHYFESKEDVIITIAKDYADKAINLIEKIAKRKDIDAIEKLNLVIESVNQYKSTKEDERSKIKNVFLDEENLKLQRKITNELKKDSVRLFKEIIDEGVEDGIFETTNSSELAEYLLHTINHMNSSIDELLLDAQEKNINTTELSKKLEDKLSFYEEMLSKILRIKKGSIELKEPYMKRFLN
ncbi:TetR/AcrR family transcriptional regulator [Natranaerofaba carboxydovora]|uniref:TetR/AcrR family transcriptional regulator n=1 Tax=Natranaerofaba carboxydovora TaxID=2742683 RepID=UPI001F12C975|nr:TetR/AcrR family transcriptional regulator [Natranaerofaba carboxydovora]UMZ72794.1 HTH-type transcriptional repressor KstR2 [Natranaerofaba carboxydovora]